MIRIMSRRSSFLSRSHFLFPLNRFLIHPPKRFVNPKQAKKDFYQKFRMDCPFMIKSYSRGSRTNDAQGIRPYIISALERLDLKDIYLLSLEQLLHCLTICSGALKIGIANWKLYERLLKQIDIRIEKDNEEIEFKELIKFYTFSANLSNSSNLPKIIRILVKNFRQNNKQLSTQLIMHYSERTYLFSQEHEVLRMAIGYLDTQFDRQHLDVNQQIQLYSYLTRIPIKNFKQLSLLTKKIKDFLTLNLAQTKNKKQIILSTLRINDSLFQRVLSQIFSLVDHSGNCSIDIHQFIEIIALLSSKVDISKNMLFFNKFLKIIKKAPPINNAGYFGHLGYDHILQMVMNNFFSKKQLKQLHFEMKGWMKRSFYYNFKILSSNIETDVPEELIQCLLEKKPKLSDQYFFMDALLLKWLADKYPFFKSQYEEFYGLITKNLPAQIFEMEKIQYQDMEIIEWFINVFGYNILPKCVGVMKKLRQGQKHVYASSALRTLFFYGNNCSKFKYYAPQFQFSSFHLVDLLLEVLKQPQLMKKRLELLDVIIDWNLSQIAKNEMRNEYDQKFFQLVVEYTLRNKQSNFTPHSHHHSQKLISFGSFLVDKILPAHLLELYCERFVNSIRQNEKNCHQYNVFLDLMATKLAATKIISSPDIVYEMIAFNIVNMKFSQSLQKPLGDKMGLYHEAIRGDKTTIQGIPITPDNLPVIIYLSSRYTQLNISHFKSHYREVKEEILGLYDVNLLTNIFLQFSDRVKLIDKQCVEFQQIYGTVILKLESEIMKKLLTGVERKKLLKVFNLIEAARSNINNPEVKKLWAVICDYLALDWTSFPQQNYLLILETNQNIGHKNDKLNRKILGVIRTELNRQYKSDMNIVFKMLYILSTVGETLENYTLNLHNSAFTHNIYRLLSYFQNSLIRVDEGKIKSISNFLKAQSSTFTLREDFYRYLEIKSGGKLVKDMKRFKRLSKRNMLAEKLYDCILLQCSEKGIPAKKITSCGVSILKIRHQYLQLSSAQLDQKHANIRVDFIKTIFQGQIQNTEVGVVLIYKRKIQKIKEEIKQKIQGLELRRMQYLDPLSEQVPNQEQQEKN